MSVHLQINVPGAELSISRDTFYTINDTPQDAIRQAVDTLDVISAEIRQMYPDLPPPSPPKKIRVGIADSIGWDDRKTLSEIYQDAGGKLTDLAESYPGLVAVAVFGARRALEGLADD